MELSITRNLISSWDPLLCSKIYFFKYSLLIPLLYLSAPWEEQVESFGVHVKELEQPEASFLIWVWSYLAGCFVPGRCSVDGWENKQTQRQKVIIAKWTHKMHRNKNYKRHVFPCSKYKNPIGMGNSFSI